MSAGWILITFHAPREPSALRVSAWRAFKQLGAISLVGGLYALPNTTEFAQEVMELGDKIVEGGGEALKFTASAMTRADEESLQRKFVEARTDEFLQVARNAGRLVEHVRRELEQEDFRLAEIESLEEELEKVRRQYRRVAVRSHFDVPAKEEADAALLAGGKVLQEYFQKAYEHETKG